MAVIAMMMTMVMMMVAVVAKKMMMIMMHSCVCSSGWSLPPWSVDMAPESKAMLKRPAAAATKRPAASSKNKGTLQRPSASSTPVVKWVWPEEYHTLIRGHFEFGHFSFRSSDGPLDTFVDDDKVLQLCDCPYDRPGGMREVFKLKLSSATAIGAVITEARFVGYQAVLSLPNNCR